LASESIGAVVGLRAEARIARRTGWDIAVGGGDAAGAMRAAEALVARGAGALISFGLAGGLDPKLGAGTILVPDAVLVDDTVLHCDGDLVARLGGATGHRILGGRDLLVDRAQKRAAWEASGAHAIDLESGAVACVARDRKLPFAVLRAICDPASRDLPAVALLALDRGGGIDPFRIARALMRAPWEIGGLLSLAQDAARARRSLMAAVARSGYGESRR
jgi:adenosylhomocysteine nucleosidase